MALLAVSSASAHARFKSSTPAKGEVLSASPAQVSITFTQEVQKVSGTFGIDVTNADGLNVNSGDATLNDDDRTLMTVPLQPNLPNGRYVVMYRNVSDADGDPFAGGFAFYVGVQPTADQLAQDAELETEDEETPAATSSVPSPGTTGPSSGTAVPPSSDGNGNDGTTVAIVIVVVIVIAGVIAGFFGSRWLMRRRT